MARIPDHEVERLRREVSLVRLVEAAGIAKAAKGSCINRLLKNACSCLDTRFAPLGTNGKCLNGCNPFVPSSPCNGRIEGAQGVFQQPVNAAPGLASER
jgi:hypothetical protein